MLAMSSKVIYGVNAVTEALCEQGRVNRIYIAKESRAHGVNALVAEAKRGKVRFDFVPQAKLNELAGTQEHQGVVAIISPVQYTQLEDCLERCGEKATLLVLDQIQHPKNLGLLIRTAVGAGVSGVLVTSRGGALLDEDVLRASAGTAFHVPLVQCGNVAQTLRKLKDAGFWVYAMDVAGGQSVFDAPWADRCALVLGNETEGLRPGVRKAADASVTIPLARDIDSLNVAVAGAIALFQIAVYHGALCGETNARTRGNG
jgi:23S rRNA (guanosine2251-2'-O)-methyltransferase